MTKTQHNLYLFFLSGLGLFIFIYYGVIGFQYYTTPLEERFFNPAHKLLKPSGAIGHGLGIIGSLMMVIGVASYMIRKRFKKFVRSGLLKYWLEFHIFMCTVGPLLVLYHTSFKFGGIVAISFWSMVAVVLSGVIGRFIYVQIPRSIQGQEYSLDELKVLNEDYTSRLRDDFHLDENIISKLDHFKSTDAYKSYGVMAVFGLIIKDFFMNRKLLAQIKYELKRKKVSHATIKRVIKLSKSKMVLARRLSLLRSIHRIFKYWHIVHLPFALIMLIIMLIHVGVTVAFGYKWIF